MQKIITALLAFSLALGLSACGGANETPTQSAAGDSASAKSSSAFPAESSAPPAESSAPLTESSTAQSPDNAVSSTAAEESGVASDKILVAYFSRMGNMAFDPGVDAVASATVQTDGTEYVGNNKIIADMLAEKTGGDLYFIEQTEKYPAAYRATTDQAKTEQNSGARPTLVAEVENMEQYGTVILVYPNWWGTLPPAVCTFLEAYDFGGKTVLPLATHEGSGLGSTARDIAALCPDATLSDGLAVRGSAVRDADADIDAWLTACGISQGLPTDPREASSVVTVAGEPTKVTELP